VGKEEFQMRVLIADDDRLSALVLRTALETSGYEVKVTTDGSEAWRVLQSEDPPRLAILDWMMPGLDGLEVCRRVRKAGGPYIYLLLLTANIDPVEVVTGINAGADDYIKKPFNPDELMARLRTGARIVELEERLRLQAMHDPLTGLLNRVAIMDRLEIEMQRALRDAAPLSLAMADLDHFKAINDTYGHLAGDAALREATRKMGAMLRSYDSIGRYGGEEFIIIFPKCDVLQAGAIAERVCRFVAEKPVDIGSRRIPVTVSIGVADMRKSQRSDLLVRAADAALFRAKATGRNQVKTARGPFAKSVGRN
jgi:two-component system cell cycle response regulator